MGSVATIERDEPTMRLNAQVLRFMSSLLARQQLAERAGLQFGGKRKLYEIFGYTKDVRPEDLLAKYQRQDIASRIVNAFPNATWSQPPKVLFSNTRNDKKWKDLTRKVRVWNVMHQADRLARMGRFSLILIGADDGAKLDKPLNEAKEILYLKPISERQVQITEFEDDSTQPNFGRPREYKITFDNPSMKQHVAGTTQVSKVDDMVVHHSRVIHIVENPLEDDVFGIPILEQVYNVLDDLLKVAGGTAETYWLTGNRGIQADVDKEMELDPDDAAELSNELEEYMHSLRRIVRTRGVKLNTLGSDPPNPKEVFDMLIAIISGTTNIPRRILMGSEAGQLASEQDRANWAESVQDRRALVVEPYILDPFINRMMEIGILNPAEYEYKWPEAFRVSPLERAQTMAAQARAVGNLSRQTGNKAPMQITSREEAREIIGLEGDLPESEMMPTDADLGGSNGQVPSGSSGEGEGGEMGEGPTQQGNQTGGAEE